MRRVVDYFGRSIEDRTFEKGIDITFAGGPSYSNTTKLGLAVLAEPVTALLGGYSGEKLTLATTLMTLLGIRFEDLQINEI